MAGYTDQQLLELVQVHRDIAEALEVYDVVYKNGEARGAIVLNTRQHRDVAYFSSHIEATEAREVRAMKAVLDHIINNYASGKWVASKTI